MTYRLKLFFELIIIGSSLTVHEAQGTMGSMQTAFTAINLWKCIRISSKFMEIEAERKNGNEREIYRSNQQSR
jgi:hypothetical protein